MDRTNIYVPMCNLLRWTQRSVWLIVTMLGVTVIWYFTMFAGGTMSTLKSPSPRRAVHVHEFLAHQPRDKLDIWEMDVPLDHEHYDSIIAPDTLVDVQGQDHEMIATQIDVATTEDISEHSDVLNMDDSVITPDSPVLVQEQDHEMIATPIEVATSEDISEHSNMLNTGESVVNTGNWTEKNGISAMEEEKSQYSHGSPHLKSSDEDTYETLSTTDDATRDWTSGDTPLVQTRTTSSERITDSTSTSQIRNNNNSMSLIEIIPHRLYLYSAILRHVSKQSDSDMLRSEIVLIGWRHKNEPIDKYKCCVWFDNGELTTVSGIKTIVRDSQPVLPANKFICSVEHSSTVQVLAVSITTKFSNCSHTPDTYLKPYVKGPAQTGLAVCSNVGYWSLGAKFLVEWFEILKVLGVSKVISYTYELNEEAMRVLRYYESNGYADVYVFDYPDNETIPRQINEKLNVQSYNDKSVAVYDCTERLGNYRYVTVMDNDEIIVPETHNLQGALLTFLEKQLLGEPTLGALSFYTRMHNISDEPLAANSMYTDHYHHCSPAIRDRPKFLYLPTRTKPGLIHTHDLTVEEGFDWFSVHPDAATTHHYRKSRQSYKNGKNEDVTQEELQYNVTCDVMRRLSQMVQESTQRIRSELGLV